VRWTEQRNMEAVLRLQAQGLLSLEDLVEIVPVEQAVDAYARLTDGPAAQPTGALVLSYGSAGRPTSTPPAEDERSPVSSAPDGVAARSKVGTGRPSVRVGLIGPGGFASRALIPALTAADAELTVVGGGAGPSAAAAARNGTFRRAAADAAAVIADPEVDAVVICTRHSDHAQLSADALRAGKHVFCEKPLALTTVERDMVLEAATAAPGILMVGFNRRFSPLLTEMRAFLSAPGLPMTLTYRVGAGTIAADHWVHDLAQGGGRAIGEGCHFLDSMAFLTGSPVVEVHAYGHGPEARPIQAYDNLVVGLTFADRSVASLVYVADGSPRLPKERLEGFCAARTAILDDYQTLDLHDDGRHHRRRLPGQDKGHRQEIAEFLRAVRTGGPALALEDIDNVTLATLALVESLRTGRPVRVAD
jgi:predicted dehydrogenase